MSAYLLAASPLFVAAALIVGWNPVARLLDHLAYRRAVAALPPLDDARWDDLLAAVDAARDDLFDAHGITDRGAS